jgi:hypothetical protein
MQVEHTYTDEDFRVLARYGTRWWHLVVAALPVVVGCVLATVPGAIITACLHHEMLALGTLAVALLGGLIWGAVLARAGVVDPSIKVPQTLTVTPEFLESKSRRGDSRWRWSCIEDVVEFEQRLLMPMGGLCWIVPESDFPTRTEFDRFAKMVRDYVGRAPKLADVDRQRPAPPGPLDPQTLQYDICFQNEPQDEDAARRAAATSDSDSVHHLRSVLVWYVTGTGVQFCVLVFPIPDLAWLVLLVGHVISFLACAAASMFAAIRLSRFVRRRDPLAGLPKRLQFSRERVAVSTSLFEQTTAWEEFEAIMHDARYVYIFRRRAPMDGVVVPKSAFASTEEIERFCQLAGAALTDAVERKKPPRVIPPRVAVESGNPYQPPGTGDTAP